MMPKPLRRARRHCYIGFMHATTQGFFLTLAAVLAWGAQLPIAAGAMQHIDPASINFIRYGLASLTLAGLLALRRDTAVIRQGLQHPLVWWAGVVGMAGSSSLVYVGLKFTRPEIAVLVIALQPTMTAMAEWVLYRRRPARVTLLCMALAFAGVSWAVTRGGELFAQPLSQVSQELLGCAFVLAGAAAWVFYTLTCARLRHWSGLHVTTLTCITSVPALALSWGVMLALGWTQWPTPEAWPELSARLTFLVFVGVVAAMFLWNTGAARFGTLNAMLMLNFMPIVTFLVRALEGVALDAAEIVGGLMVVLALVTNNLWQRRQQP
jgi:drug/metabolite transporter (DMT)-like permease